MCEEYTDWIVWSVTWPYYAQCSSAGLHTRGSGVLRMQSGTRQVGTGALVHELSFHGGTMTPPWISVFTKKGEWTMFKYKALSVLYNLCPSKKLKRLIWEYANAEFPIVERWINPFKRPNLARWHRVFANDTFQQDPVIVSKNDDLATRKSKSLLSAAWSVTCLTHTMCNYDNTWCSLFRVLARKKNIV